MKGKKAFLAYANKRLLSYIEDAQDVEDDDISLTAEERFQDFLRYEVAAAQCAEVERIAARRGKPPRRRRSMWVGHR